jgi:hypothetical protein
MAGRTRLLETFALSIGGGRDSEAGDPKQAEANRATETILQRLRLQNEKHSVPADYFRIQFISSCELVRAYVRIIRMIMIQVTACVN